MVESLILATKEGGVADGSGMADPGASTVVAAGVDVTTDVTTDATTDVVGLELVVVVKIVDAPDVVEDEMAVVVVAFVGLGGEMLKIG